MAKKQKQIILYPLGYYASLMNKCGVWAIARMMDKSGLDISLALRALRMSNRQFSCLSVKGS